MLAGRVFAIDWAVLLTLPGLLRRAPASDGQTLIPPREKSARPGKPAFAPLDKVRKPPEITDPASTAKPAPPRITPLT